MRGIEGGKVQYLFEVQGIGQKFAVVRVAGSEGMSELFAFTLTLTSEDGAIVFDDVVGRDALLTIGVGEERRFVHGIVRRFEQMDEGRNVTAYELQLVPRAWRLLHRHDSRIFQELTYPKIIETVLQAAGITSKQFRMNLAGNYRTREYCVQYREPDWNFIERLAEEEGIYYFFEHRDDDHVLVFADAPWLQQPIAGSSQILFRPSLGGLTSGEHVTRLRHVEEVRPGKVALRDWNFKKPELQLDGAASSDKDTDLEIYDYPGDYDAMGDAGPLARVRLEQQQVVRRMVRGESGCARFIPGGIFGLEEHTRDAFNRKYLITHIDHEGAQSQMGEAAAGSTSTYHNKFVCIPDDIPFRAPSRTPRPTIKGIQTAIVVGPAGEEVYTDEHGRVKVQFHWDRQGKRDARSSCWIRVSQIWAGAAWGTMYIPRIGHEVVVDFLEGDPDRPLIVGRVYHGANVPPYPLPANKTTSTMKSNSSPGGEGSNEFRFEDKKGQEEIYLHGQKNWTIRILNNKDQNIGHDENLHVQNDREVLIGQDQTSTIGRDFVSNAGRDSSTSVGRDSSLQVGANQSVSIAVNQTQNVGGEQSVKIGGKRDESIGSDTSLTVGGAKRETIGDDSEETITKDKNVSVGKNLSIAVGANSDIKVAKNAEETVEGSKTVTVGEKVVIECGDSRVVLEKDGTITVEGKDIKVKGSGNVVIEGDQKVEVKSSGDVKVSAASNVVVKGSGVNLN